MKSISIADHTIRTALTTRQIGVPVAARMIAHLTPDHGPLERTTVQALETAAAWLGGVPIRVTAMGGAKTGQISVLAVLEGGQSVLACVGSCGMGPPLMEGVVWGNHGILAWEDDAVFWRQRAQEDAPLSDQAQKLLSQIRHSLGAQPKLKPPARPAFCKEKPRRKSQKPPFGVLLVAGDHTHQTGYAEALQADKRCKIIGLTDEENISDRRRKYNRRLAERMGIPVLGDLRQSLRRDDVHIVSICAEPIRRGQIAMEAARAGKHLYLDKPLTATLEEARGIAAAAAESNVVSHMFSQIHSDASRRVHQAVQSGDFGELSVLHFDLCFTKGHAGSARLGALRKESPNPKRYELKDSKRELSNVGVYPLCHLLHLTHQRVRHVAASTGNYFFAEHQSNNMEDFGQMLLQLENGVVATLSVGRTGWLSYPAGGMNRTTLVGAGRAYTFDAQRPRVSVWCDKPAWTAPKRDPEDPMGMWAGPKSPEHTPPPRQTWITPPPESISDARHFLDCVESGRESDISAALAAHTTEVLLAGYRSAATGETIST